MRYAIDLTHRLFPGGIKSYIENLLPPLVDEVLRADEELVGVYRTRDSRAIDRTPPIRGLERRVVGIPTRILTRLENTVGLPNFSRWTGKIDAFHGTHFHQPVFGRRAPNRVLTVHDLTYLRHPEYYRDRRLNDYGYRYLLKHSLERTDLVLTISHSTKRDLAELCGFPEERIWVVSFGIDPTFRVRGEDDVLSVRARYAIDRPYVMYSIGSIDHRKNLPATLEAYARAFPSSDERPLLLLTGVGDAPTLEALTREHGLDGDVRLESARSTTDIASLLSGARWALYPSLYEGFGLPILEALACGAPLITSDRSSCPEVAQNAALTVDPIDVDALSHAMSLLDADLELRTKLRRAGLERANDSAFQWDRAARQTRAAYRGDRTAYDREIDPLSIRSGSDACEDNGSDRVDSGEFESVV